IVLRGRDDRVIPEALAYIAAGELTRHEAQLDERSNAVGQKTIVHLVDVGEVVYGLSMRSFRVHAQLVVQDAVEADVGDRRDAALTDLGVHSRDGERHDQYCDRRSPTLAPHAFLLLELYRSHCRS